jgi:hypothetical protein
MIRGTFKTNDPVVISHERVRGVVETKGYFEAVGNDGDDLGTYFVIRTGPYEKTEIYMADIVSMDYDELQAIRDHDRGVVFAF